MRYAQRSHDRPKPPSISNNSHKKQLAESSTNRVRNTRTMKQNLAVFLAVTVALVGLPSFAQATEDCPLVPKDETCYDQWQQCYKITAEELTNPYGGCCDGLYCTGSSIWYASCQPIPSGYVMPPNPLGDITEYITEDCAGSEYDTCPEAMNLGSELSASTDYQGEFPTLEDPVDLANPYRDDSIAFLIKGTYTSQQAAEIEGKIVVLGDFIVKPDGVNSLVHAGVGSGVVPNDGQIVMTGKYKSLDAQIHLKVSSASHILFTTHHSRGRRHLREKWRHNCVDQHTSRR